MRLAELESKTIAAIDALRRGESVEDDLLEVKSSWPDASKVRQFAGLCNRARGHEVVMIIGVADKEGTVVPVSGEPVDWWAKFSAKFDEVSPDLVHHIRVSVGDGESVIALQFDTSRVPFLVKVDGAANGVHREIPIRDATGTRTAMRHEVMRLLAPTIKMPEFQLSKAAVQLSWQEQRSTIDEAGNRAVEPHSADDARITGQVAIYVEHLVPDFVMVRTERLECSLASEEMTVSLTPWMHTTNGIRATSPSPPRQYGIDHRPEGALITGPGLLNLHFGQSIRINEREALASSPHLTLRIGINIDGSEIAPRLTGRMARREPPHRGYGVGQFRADFDLA